MGACYSENRDEGLAFEENAENEINHQNWEAAIVWIEKAIATNTYKYGPEDESVGRLYHKLADISYGKVNSYETIDFYERALTILAPIYSEADIRTEAMCEKIAYLYWEDKRYSEAVQFYQKLLRIRKAMYGDVALEVADIYHRLGEGLELVERYDDAETNFIASIEIKKKHPKAVNSLALSYQNLGMVYLESLLDYKKAKEMFEMCIAIYKGNDSARDINMRETCMCLFKLGETKLRMGDFRNSKKDLENAIRLAKSIQWEDKTHGVNLQLNGNLLLSGVYELLNKEKDMLEADKSWLILQMQDLSLSDYEMSYLHYCLGNIYMKLEQYDLALSELENSLVYAKLTRNTEFEQVRIGLMIGRIYASTNKIEEAKIKLAEISDYFGPEMRRKYPEDNLLLKRALAYVQIRNNETETGLNRLKEIASICEQVLGEGNYHTIRVNFEIAQCLKYTGDFEGALGILRRLLDNYSTTKIDFKPPSDDFKGDIIDVEGMLIDIGPFHDLPKLGPATWMNELERGHLKTVLFSFPRISPTEREISKLVSEISHKKNAEDENDSETAKTIESNSAAVFANEGN